VAPDAEQVISLKDHDGLMLEIVAHAAAGSGPAGERPAISRSMRSMAFLA